MIPSEVASYSRGAPGASERLPWSDSLAHFADESSVGAFGAAVSALVLGLSSAFVAGGSLV